MAVGLAAATANSILDALCRGQAWTAPTAVFVQLHTADPGAVGTTAVATEADRVQATFAAASGGAISNSGAITWSAVAAAEDFTFFSAWDAVSAGTFLFSGPVTANAVASGDDFTIPAGELDVGLTVAAG